ncbi:DUF4169 family protein [Sphingomonas sp. LaA6.9]|uniref:DUF4169 family protein n=1 Tax=Sphingomonas sp. LaA6.9 TaxID=2919914 RepID=UPI001F4FCEE3|nr:DUF4169 family protein [Sphingomonas sp. LaA6.9]MCJ8158971.1 DUF4169 family protein [Sphingomonas sp. LaA6.9]
MAEIINLRLARKAKTRADAAQKASENRAKFGRTGAQKAADKAQHERHERALDQAKRDTDD